MGQTDRILSGVERYYAQKISAHGASPAGVDWNGAESQALRFDQLSRVISQPSGATINDIGCGYGAYFDYLRTRWPDIAYAGYDISPAMIEEAMRRHPDEHCCRFSVGSQAAEQADYSIASGIFNVRLEVSDEDWWAHIIAMLDQMHETSQRGFAANFLTSYSDREHMQPRLFYADPARLFTHCKTRYARNVALLHDYGLYEFTLLIRKDI